MKKTFTVLQIVLCIIRLASRTIEPFKHAQINISRLLRALPYFLRYLVMIFIRGADETIIGNAQAINFLLVGGGNAIHKLSYRNALLPRNFKRLLAVLIRTGQKKYALIPN